MAEDERVGWHHRLDGHESEQMLRDGGGQGSLACCSLRGSPEGLHSSTATPLCGWTARCLSAHPRTGLCAESTSCLLRVKWLRASVYRLCADVCSRLSWVHSLQ